MPMMTIFTACRDCSQREKKRDERAVRTAVRIPEIQNAFPKGAGWKRKMRAKNTPPALPIAPTIPLC